MKYHDLIEAHVRVYCIRHDQGQTYQMLPMRLQQPDDDKGGMLLTALPNTVVHRIDGWSPLAPAWADLQTARDDQTRRPSPDVDLSLGRPLRAYAWPDVPQRQVDADQGNRDSYVCSTCGESFQSLAMLRKHALYNSYQDPHNGLPAELCHKAWPEDCSICHAAATGLQASAGAVADAEASGGVVPNAPVISPSEFLSSPTRLEVEQFLQRRYMEVVVIVEGIEPTTSCTLQARHSYLFPEDITWDADFADCMLPGTATSPCTVDLGRFHELVPTSLSHKLEQYATLV